MEESVIASAEASVATATVLAIIIPVILLIFVLGIKIGWGIFVGNIAKKKGYEFAGFFILGIVSFIIGLIVSLCLDDRNAKPKAFAKAFAEAFKNSPQSTAEELLQLKKLLDANVISQEEFDANKKQLLGL